MIEHLIKQSETYQVILRALDWLSPLTAFIWISLKLYETALKLYPKMTMALEKKIYSCVRALMAPTQRSIHNRQQKQLNEPPRLAEFLVGVFAKKRYRKAILSDLAEDFDSDLAAGISVSHAGRRYWAAALNSIGPQLLAALKRFGFWGLIVEVTRRITG